MRKQRNGRGKLTRRLSTQLIPEAEFITVNKQKVKNPAYPGMRTVNHFQAPK